MEDIGQYALKIASSADYADVRVEQNTYSGFMMNNGTPEASSFSTSKGIGVRVIHKGSMGFCSINEWERPKVRAAVQHALRMARAAARYNKQPIVMSEEKAYRKRIRVKPKKNPADLDADQKLKLLKSFDTDVQSHGISVPSRQFSFSHTDNEELFLSTDGAKITMKNPRLSLFWFISVLCGKKVKQRYFQYNATAGLEALRRWRVSEGLAHEAKALYNNLKKAKRAPKGVFDVICGPEVTGIATHESAGHPYEADRILGREAAQAGESFITQQMLGDRMADPIVSVVDDPTLENTAGSYAFDAEGVKSRRNYILRKGRINTFLHDRETAAAMGTHSNGASRATGFNREPIVRMGNTFVEKGKSSEEEIIANTKKGIFLKNFMEWNIDDRRYNQKYVGAEAYYVERGKIKHPLNNPVLEISTPKFWSSIDMVGKNVQHFAATCGKGEPMQGIPVTTGGPTIRLKNIRLR